MIGVMDWGIGGMSVYTALRRSGSTVDVLYLSDSGAPPYGRLPAEDLRRRLKEVAKFFGDRGIDEVLVACNAASSALAADTEMVGKVRLHSIVPAAVQSAKSAKGQRIGVIGGERTIQSNLYQNRLTSSSKTFSFEAAQPLSAFVEAGELAGAAVESCVQRILEALGPIDALLLACTHYPALTPVFKKLAPDLELLDPAENMATSHSNLLSQPGASRVEFVTSGPVEISARSALRAFGVTLAHPRSLSLGLT